MKKLIIILMVLPLMLSAQETPMNELLKGFEEPGNAWRGKPFWSWNGGCAYAAVSLDLRNYNESSDKSSKTKVSILLFESFAFCIYMYC